MIHMCNYNILQFGEIGVPLRESGCKMGQVRVRAEKL